MAMKGGFIGGIIALTVGASVFVSLAAGIFQGLDSLDDLENISSTTAVLLGLAGILVAVGVVKTLSDMSGSGVKF
jgi:hypothetical protein